MFERIRRDEPEKGLSVEPDEAVVSPSTIERFHLFRLANGRVADHWHQIDALSIVRQLGALPEPSEAELTHVLRREPRECPTASGADARRSRAWASCFAW